MTDREKVMQWLETCANGCEDGCPYEYKNLVYRVECKADLMSDALELLKEQEAVEPKLVGVNTWTCGKCDTLLGWEEFSQSGLELVKYKYCPECGNAVKWND